VRTAEQAKRHIGALHIFAPTMVYVDFDGTLKTRDQFLSYVKNDTSRRNNCVSERLEHPPYGEFAVSQRLPRQVEQGGKPTTLRGRYVTAWAKLTAPGNAFPPRPL